jgi:hypothetical protein
MANDRFASAVTCPETKQLRICHWPRGSTHREDHLALGAAALQVGHRLAGFFEREYAVDDDDVQRLDLVRGKVKQ